MKQTETAKLLAVIKTAYPNFEITPAVTVLWHDFLQHMDSEEAQLHLREHIISNRFPPTIADIVKFNRLKHELKLAVLSRERDDAFAQFLLEGGDPEEFNNEPWHEKRGQLNAITDKQLI